MMRKQHACEPAASIVRLLGGEDVVRRWLEISDTTVHRWQRADRTAGFIPRNHHDRLIELSIRRGVFLLRSDFVRSDPLTLEELQRRKQLTQRVA